MRTGPLLRLAVVVVLVAAAVAVSAGYDTPSDLVLYTLLPLTVAGVGAVVSTRQPGNAIGPLFGWFAVYIALAEVAQGYGVRAAATGLPYGAYGDWVIAWTWAGELAVWAVILVLFPDGRLPGPRWRWVVRCAAGGFVVAACGFATSAAWQDSFPGGRNPLAVTGSGPVLLGWVGIALLVGAHVAAAASFLRRLRAARGAEQQQLKLVALAGALMLLVILVVALLWPWHPEVEALLAVGFNLLPLAVGIAIVRHGLFDVDVVIRRTLVYAVVTACLAATYLAIVLLLQVVLNPLPEPSDLAVAGSTLAVAALFRPVRGRVQAGVDRRFYRHRYDAQRTLDAFGTRLRATLDVEAVGDDLREVVETTMQPRQVVLWLRPGPEGT